MLKSRTFASLKFGSLLLLAAAFDVLCVQEAHGSEADVWELSRRLHASHSIWFSLRSSSASGGILFIVKRTFLTTLINYRFTVVSHGRVAILSLFFPNGAISFMNVHILPNLPIAARRDLFRRMSSTLPELTRHSIFLLGDWNFLAAGESNFNFVQGVEINRDDGSSFHFGSIFPSFTELLQDAPTHKDSATLSRLDRIYTNLPLAGLLDLSLRAGTQWDFSHSRSSVSDHLPVFVHVSRKLHGESRRVLPRWVAEHPDSPSRFSFFSTSAATLLTTLLPRMPMPNFS